MASAGIRDDFMVETGQAGEWLEEEVKEEMRLRLAKSGL